MVFTHQTILSCEAIEKRIEAEAEVFGLMMKKYYPFSKNLPKNGFEIKEYASVFELCLPSLAADLLNTQPELNVLMPCRISLYEKDGNCYAATPDLEVQLEIMGCKEELKTQVLALYNQMTTMIKGW